LGKYRYRLLNFDALWRDYPPAPDYFDTTYRRSRALKYAQPVMFSIVAFQATSGLALLPDGKSRKNRAG